jgi:signal peptidase I
MFGVWFFTFRPAYLGGPVSFVLVHGVSMRPTLQNGDLVVVRDRGAYVAGDVVAFHVPANGSGEGGLVIHRIVGGSAATGYATQGDNREGPDPWRPMASDIAGELWLRIPGGARAIAWVRDPIVFAGLAASFTVFQILSSPVHAPGKRRRHALGAAAVGARQLLEIRSGSWAFPMRPSEARR